MKTWWRWHRNEETHRFHQGVGKQYKYQKGVPELPEIEQLKIALRQKELELEILKKYKALLSNTIEWLQLNKCEVAIKFKRYTSSSPTSNNKKVMQFLNDIEFFSEYMDVEISEPLGKRRNTCPLELINSKDSVSWVRNNFIPWLGGILNVNVADLDY